MAEARIDPSGVIYADPQRNGRQSSCIQPRSASHSLSSIFILYESRKTWAARAEWGGFTPGAANEASYWLMDREEIAKTVTALNSIADAHRIKVTQLNIETFIKNINQYINSDTHNALIWNITDGLANFKGSNLVAFADMCGIPYFGCPIFAQALGQDKFKLYQLCHSLGIPVPSSRLVEGKKVLGSVGNRASGPYFVKPNSLGNKAGIDRKSYCGSEGSAFERAAKIGEELHTRMVIQQFIDGPEIRLTFIDGAEEGYRFGYEVVDENTQSPSFVSQNERDSAYDKYLNAEIWSGLPNAIKASALKQMAEVVQRLGQHIQLKDYFTFDFRLDTSGVPWIIDFNPGAFLYGKNVEGYADRAFGTTLAQLLITAMRRCYERHQRNRGHFAEICFRI